MQLLNANTSAMQATTAWIVKTKNYWSVKDKLVTRAKYCMFSPGIEPGTFRVLGGCDNHYTTETELRSEAGETARLLQAGILCHKQSLATGQDLDIWSIPHGNGLKRGLSGLKQTFPKLCLSGRDRLVVRTLRCGRSNPGSNPGHGRR